MALLFMTIDLIHMAISVILMYFSWRLVGRYMRRRHYKLPPGPVGWPIVGNVAIENHASLFDHRDRFGDISYLNAFGSDIFFLNSPNVIRDAFQGRETAEIFSGRPPTFIQEYIFHNDIILRSMTDEKWKQQRNLFHVLLKQYGDGIQEIERVVTAELKVVISKLHKKVGNVVRLDDYLLASLINILFILLIGERFDYDHWTINVSRQLTLDSLKMSGQFITVMLNAMPFLRFLPFGVGAKYRQVVECWRQLLDFLYRDRKKLSPDVLETHKGLVYELIRLQRQNSWITAAEIEGLIMDTFSAGLMTTYSSLRVFFLVMLYYPDVQKKIQNEVDVVVGNLRAPSVSDRTAMSYTEAAILELSRYASIAHMAVPHTAVRDAEFRGFTFPRNCLIMPNLFRAHHDENVWDNPSVFNPGRFLNEEGNILPATHNKRKNLLPFGIGKRVCLGEKFARTRMFLYVSSLLQIFTVKSVGEQPRCHPLFYDPQGLLNPQTYSIKLERRA